MNDLDTPVHAIAQVWLKHFKNILFHSLQKMISLFLLLCNLIYVDGKNRRHCERLESSDKSKFINLDDVSKDIV